MLAHVIVLRARPFRSVVLEMQGARVSKRFHHSSRLQALLDGARARREFAALRALEHAGLPVPHAAAVRATAQGWELELAAVAGARSLRELLDLGETPPGGWERLVPRLGRLLARLLRLGWEHGDLHPGNVLVDGGGEAWLIDLAAARRAPPDAARALSEVVHCAALARELLPARLRARFLVAWLRELPEELRPRLRGLELAFALERRARLRRRHQVRLGLGRWLRESSRVRRVVLRERTLWLRRDLADAALGDAQVEGASLDLPGGLPADWPVVRGTAAEVRALWLGAARLHEHRLPVARPAAYSPGSRRRARDAWAAFEPPAPGERTRSRAVLDALLAERGLALASTAPGARATAAGYYLLPLCDSADVLELEDGLDRSSG